MTASMMPALRGSSAYPLNDTWQAASAPSAPRSESVLTPRRQFRRLPTETAPSSWITQNYEGTNQIKRMVMARQQLK